MLKMGIFFVIVIVWIDFDVIGYVFDFEFVGEVVIMEFGKYLKWGVGVFFYWRN